VCLAGKGACPHGDCRLINFGASWPDFCARRDDALFTSDNVTSFGSGFGLAA
jgi:hypothetical protein